MGTLENVPVVHSFNTSKENTEVCGNYRLHGDDRLLGERFFFPSNLVSFPKAEGVIERRIVVLFNVARHLFSE